MGIEEEYSRATRRYHETGERLGKTPKGHPERAARERGEKRDSKANDFFGKKTMNPDLQKHIANDWLFKGLNGK